MRIAVLSDIHGNLPAFEAALQHARGQGADQILVGGDVCVGAPDAKACWDLAESLNCPTLRGNHERYMALYGTPEAHADWESDRFAPLHWAVAEVDEAARQKMGRLPHWLRLPGAPGVFFAHATERGDHESISLYTPEADLRAMFPTAREELVVRGHNHQGQVRLWAQGRIVTCGSVGMPLDGNPSAQYLLVDDTPRGWEIQHQAVQYKLQDIVARYHDSGYLNTVGPVGRLYYREVVTGSHQLVPFLRLWAEWQQEAPISLEAAAERFFAL